MAAINESTICEAARLLLQAAPNATVILFGSCARGEYGQDSDMDFLVLEPDVKSRMEESVRLRDVLRPLRVPADVIVTTYEIFQKWRQTPGTIAYEAEQEGRVFHALA